MTDTVWNNGIDNGAYECAVLRDPDEAYRGWLIITDTKANEVVHKESVGLAFAARFGPDTDDVQTWMERSVAVVDNPVLRMIEQ